MASQDNYHIVPHPKLKRDYKGRTVRTTRELKNGWGIIPVGAIGLIDIQSPKGSSIVFETCSCCNMKPIVSGVHMDSIEFVEPCNELKKGAIMTIKTEPITGNFVLSAPDGKWESDDKDNLTFITTHTVYLESSVGKGKAKYWTDSLENALVFTDLEKAVSMRDETNREHSPVSILQLKHS